MQEKMDTLQQPTAELSPGLNRKWVQEAYLVGRKTLRGLQRDYMSFQSLKVSD